ncbi:hypothetical protein AVEN_273831-1 [Araneus ventricosus]|uniref:Uncharacterized protein n=1 Tax=Araneus ventricosus TaxID=182803 RepID=A0A4Y2L2P2_ARAVE|nr:hypothetical protein AVEN_273831-1 [Araneus ventricosus]
MIPTVIRNLPKNLYAGIVEERKAKEEIAEKQCLEALAEAQRKAELEEKRQKALAELKKENEVELERLRVEAKLKLGTTTTEADYSKLPSKEVSKFLHRFEVKEDISLYLILSERQVHRLSIPLTDTIPINRARLSLSDIGALKIHKYTLSAFPPADSVVSEKPILLYGQFLSENIRHLFRIDPTFSHSVVRPCIVAC